MDPRFPQTTGEPEDLAAVKGIHAGDPLTKAAELAQAIVLRYEPSGRAQKLRVLILQKKRAADRDAENGCEKREFKQMRAMGSRNNPAASRKPATAK